MTDLNANPVNDDEDKLPAVALYGKMLTFSRIKLRTSNLGQIESHLSSILPHKDSQIPVVIDSDVEQDLPQLIDLLWSWGLQPIGAVTGTLDDEAKACKLAIFPSDGKRIERIRPTKNISKIDNKTVTADIKTDIQSQVSDSPVAESLEQVQATDAKTQDTQKPDTNNAVIGGLEADIAGEQVTNMIYDQMLRSGQSINYVGGDLILTNSVNHGAEVITDNSLHIYGRAQGRLVAGATGDKDARIFCMRFNPSLVSVAGTYCLSDDIPKEFIDKAVQVRFDEGDGLVFELLENF